MDPRLRGLALGAAAAVCTAVTAIAPRAASADVNNAALCKASLDVALHDGAYSASGNALDCTGMLSGRLVGANGWIDMWGDYTTSGCQVTFTDSVFYAQPQLALAFFDGGALTIVGGQSLGAGVVTGSGQANSMPFLVDGLASFTPAGSDCSTLSSGTLTETLTLTDGGDGNPAAVTAVTAHLQQEYGATRRPVRHRHRRRAGRR
jgi:hypothetical protein